MEFISVPLIILIIFGTFYKIIKLYAMRRERILYIEKMSELPPIDSTNSPAPYPSLFSESSAVTGLRWGLLATGVGLGIFVAIITVLCINYKAATYPGLIVDDYAIVVAACMFFFGGLGLVTSYIIENRRAKRNNK